MPMAALSIFRLPYTSDLERSKWAW